MLVKGIGGVSPHLLNIITAAETLVYIYKLVRITFEYAEDDIKFGRSKIFL